MSKNFRQRVSTVLAVTVLGSSVTGPAIASTHGLDEEVTSSVVEALESTTPGAIVATPKQEELTEEEVFLEAINARTSDEEKVFVKVGEQVVGFATISEALENVESGTASHPSLIMVTEGTYEEKLTINKSYLRIIGEGAQNTKITYGDYAAKIGEDGKVLGQTKSASVFIKGNNIQVEGICFENSYDESDRNRGAVAVAIEANRVAFEDCKFLGNENTLLVDGGTQYFNRCYIEGDVDFIFGKSQAVFEACEIHSLATASTGFITAPRTNKDEAYGFLFVNCDLTAERDVKSGSVYLGRPWCPTSTETERGSVLLKGCYMEGHIASSGWSKWNDSKPVTLGRFYEFENQGEGAILSRSRYQLSAADAKRWTMKNVLKGWMASETYEADEMPLAAEDTYLAPGEVQEGEALFKDEFENVTALSQVEYTVSNGTAAIKKGAGKNGAGLVLEDTNSGQAILQKSFDKLEGKVTLSLDICHEGQVKENATPIRILSSGRKLALRLDIINKQLVVRYSDANGQKVMIPLRQADGKVFSPQADEWYNLQIVLDTTTECAEIYLNNVKATKENVDFYQMDQLVQNISIIEMLTPGTLKYDNVTVYKGEVVNSEAGEVPDISSYPILVKNADGTEMGCSTIQEAVDCVESGTADNPSVIVIKGGTYKEVITVPANKKHIQFIGEKDAAGELPKLTYDNYSGKDNGNGGTFGTGGSSSVFIYGSDLSFEGIVFENGFDENTVPDKDENGKNNQKQAVALQVTGERVSFTGCTFLGNQDTLLLDGGTQYFYDCYIEGDVDFIFGRSQAVFEECEIHSLNRNSSNNGYITAARTSTEEAYGFLFLECRLTAEEGTAEDTVSLGRPWCPTGTTVERASVLFKDCEMGAHIKAEGWSKMSDVPASFGRFYEFGSTGEGAIVSATRPQLAQDLAQRWTIKNVLKGWMPSAREEMDQPPLTVAETLPSETPEIVDGTPIFEDSFEGISSLRQLAYSTAIKGSVSGKANVSLSEGKQGQGVTLTDEGTATATLSKSFAKQEETMTISLDVYHIDEVVSSTIPLRLLSDNRQVALRLETMGKQLAVRYPDTEDGKVTIPLKAASGIKFVPQANTWYNLKAVVKIAEQAIDIYIDDVLAAENVPLYTMGGNITNVSGLEIITPGTNEGSLKVDNISVYKGNVVTPVTPDLSQYGIRIEQADGTTIYCETVQEAFDNVESGTAEKNAVIYINQGTYKEVMTLPKDKHHITIKGVAGENGELPLLTYDNYAGKDNGKGGTMGTSGSSSVYVYGSDISFENIIFENSFDETSVPDKDADKKTISKQAVALMVTGERVSFTGCKFIANQDTLLVDGGTQYFYDCYIEGDVDFIFGRSQAVFEKCQLHSVDRGNKVNGYIIAPRTSIKEPYGFLFLNCDLTADEGIAANSVYLGRPWCPTGTGVDQASVLFKNCTMGAHITEDGWSGMSKVPASHGRFYEYNSQGEGAFININREQLTEALADRWTIRNVLNPVLNGENYLDESLSVWMPSHTAEAVLKPLSVEETKRPEGLIVGQTVFEDDFETEMDLEELGYKTTYKLGSTASDVSVVAEAGRTSNGLVITDDLNETVTLNRAFETQDGTVTASLDIYHQDEVVSGTVVFKALSQNRKTAFRIEVVGQDLVARYRNNGTEKQMVILKGANDSAFKIKANTWYNLKVVLNVPNQTATVYINDVLAAENLPFYEEYGVVNKEPIAKNIASLEWISAGSKKGDLKLDNVKMCLGDIVKENIVGRIFKDDFNEANVSLEALGYELLNKQAQGIALEKYSTREDGLIVFKGETGKEIGVTKVVNTTAPIMTAAADFMTSGRVATQMTPISLVDSKGKTVASVVVKQGKLYLNDVLVDIAVEENTWYDLKLVVTEDKAQLYIDGIMQADASLVGSAESIAALKTSVASKGTTLYVDNIALYHTSYTAFDTDKAKHDILNAVIRVNQDGTGDYTTVQAAIDSIAENVTVPTTIYIHNGIYEEVITVPKNKNHITLVGESAEGTVLQFNNYAGKLDSAGKKIGTTSSASFFVKGDDFTAQNITFANTFDETATDTTSKQAVALYTEGLRSAFVNCRFLGDQDTLYVKRGTSYFKDCYIEGDVDFIFGGASAVFEGCTLFSKNRNSVTNNGYITAPNTSETQAYGFLFENCKLEAEEGTAANSVYLGRPWQTSGASALFKNCELGEHIKEEGWDQMSGIIPDNARLYEYGNYGPGAITGTMTEVIMKALKQASVDATLSRKQLSKEEADQWQKISVLDGWDVATHINKLPGFMVEEEWEEPEVPETPESPETPEVPETPESPETPEVPETPESPETPEVPEQGGSGSGSSRPSRPSSSTVNKDAYYITEQDVAALIKKAEDNNKDAITINVTSQKDLGLTYEIVQLIKASKLKEVVIHKDNMTVTLPKTLLEVKQSENLFVTLTQSKSEKEVLWTVSLACGKTKSEAKVIDVFKEAINVALRYEQEVNENILTAYASKTLENLGGYSVDSIYYVAIPGSCTVMLKENNVVFEDVSEVLKGYESIQFLAAKGYIQGVSQMSFAPQKEMTRAEFATMLARLLKLEAASEHSVFADVKADSWYEEAVQACYEAGLIQGTGKNKFAPNEKIKREDMLVMLARIYANENLTNKEQADLAYEDVSQIAAYAKESIATCISLGLIDNKGKLEPKQIVNREEMAIMFAKLVKFK